MSFPPAPSDVSVTFHLPSNGSAARAVPAEAKTIIPTRTTPSFNAGRMTCSLCELAPRMIRPHRRRRLIPSLVPHPPLSRRVRDCVDDVARQDAPHAPLLSRDLTGPAVQVHADHRRVEAIDPLPEQAADNAAEDVAGPGLGQRAVAGVVNVHPPAVGHDGPIAFQYNDLPERARRLDRDLDPPLVIARHLVPADQLPQPLHLPGMWCQHRRRTKITRPPL